MDTLPDAAGSYQAEVDAVHAAGILDGTVPVSRPRARAPVRVEGTPTPRRLASALKLPRLGTADTGWWNRNPKV